MVVELCKFLVEEGIFDEEIMTIVLDERLPTSRFHHSPPHQYYTSRENREEGRARKHRTKSFSSKKGRKLATIEESPLVPVKPELLAVFDADAKMLKQAILDEMKFNEQSPPRKGLIGIQEVEQFLR
jgi:hypothetical protein